MKRFLLCFALALFFPLSVSAAEPFDWDGNYSWGEYNVDKEFEVPYTGNYHVTMCGAQGGTYQSTGQKSDTVEFDIDLNKGDILAFSCGQVGGKNLESSSITINSGDKSLLYLNGDIIVSVRGGTATIKEGAIVSDRNLSLAVASAVTGSIHYHSKSSGTMAYNDTTTCIYSTSNPGGCFKPAGHTHDATGSCSRYAAYRHECNSGCRQVEKKHYTEHTEVWFDAECSCGGCWNEKKTYEYSHSTYEWEHSSNQVFSHWVYNCGSPTNTWTIQCGKNHGGIYGLSSITNNEVTTLEGILQNATTKSESNEGAGSLSIFLNDHSNLVYNSGAVKADPTYLDGAVDMVIVDDTVVYYKR